MAHAINVSNGSVEIIDPTGNRLLMGRNYCEKAMFISLSSPFNHIEYSLTDGRKILRGRSPDSRRTTSSAKALV